LPSARRFDDERSLSQRRALAVLTLRARFFSKIKEKVQYKQRRESAESKERVSGTKGLNQVNQRRESAKSKKSDCKIEGVYLFHQTES